jgi:hypothetical protein
MLSENFRTLASRYRAERAAPSTLPGSPVLEGNGGNKGNIQSTSASFMFPLSQEEGTRGEQTGVCGISSVPGAGLVDARPVPGPNATHVEVAAWIERRAAEALNGYEPPTFELDWLAQDEITTAYLRASLQRQPSWWWAEAHRPTPGAICACCGGQRWWSRDQLGWCCSVCHPPVPGAAVCEVHS